jgi:hypothetical protein
LVVLWFVIGSLINLANLVDPSDPSVHAWMCLTRSGRTSWAFSMMHILAFWRISMYDDQNIFPSLEK